MTISAIWLPVFASRLGQRPDYSLSVEPASLVLTGQSVGLEASENRRLDVTSNTGFAFTGNSVSLLEDIDFSLSVTMAALSLVPKTLTFNYKIPVTNAAIGFLPKDLTLSPSTTTETVLLSGTSGAPNYIYSEGIEGFVDAYAGIRANINGSLQGETYSSTWLAAYTINTNEWVDNASYTDEYWIRATTVASYNSNLNGTLNTWQKLNLGTRTWYITKINSSAGERWHTLKLEISTDSGGSTIVATGYYKLHAQVGF